MRATTALLFFSLAGCSGGSGATQKPTEAEAHEHEAPAAPPLPAPADPPPSNDAPTSNDGPRSTTLATVGDAACTFEITYTSDDTSGATKYTLRITKRDTHDGSCAEPKGTSTLLASSYERPVAFAAIDSHAKYLVVTFDGRYAPDSAIYTRLLQIDWTSGQHLHEGQMAVTGSSPFPVPDVLKPRDVAIEGRDVVLTVDGRLPGAGDGDTFAVTYAGFLDVDPQQPSPATHAEPVAR